MHLNSKIIYIYSALLLFMPLMSASAQTVEMTTISGRALDENGNVIGSMHVGANLFKNSLGEISPIGPGGPGNPGPGGNSPLSSIQRNMPDLFQYSTDSDEDGYYKLSVPPGDYKIVARSGRYSPVSPLYANQFYPGVFDFYSASSVKTSISKPAEGINFFLREGRAIEGKITAYGEPLAGVFVRARSFTTPAASGAFTNADGLFNITLVPASDYRISTFSTEYTNEFYKEGADGGTTTRYDDATLVDITDTSYSGVDMSLVRGGTINGYVLEKNGIFMKPDRIANASVYAVSQKENWSGTTKSSQDGSYAMSAPRTDDIIVYYAPGTGENYVTAYHKARNGSVYSMDGAVAVDITSGSAYAVNLFMRRGVVISGSISDDSASSVANVQVNAFSSDFSKYGSSITDENGDFSFVVYPGKEYILSAYTPTYGKFFYGDLWTVTSMDNASLVKTYSGKISNLNITMVRGNKISGVIYNADLSTASGVTVSAFSENTGNGGETQSGSDGSYSIVVPDSEDYIVWSNVTGKPDSFYVTKAASTTTKWESASFVSTVSGDQSGVDITIPEYKTVSGILSGSSGNTLAGKWVIAYSVSTGEMGIETTDASGGYFIGLPVRKDYVVYAFETENFLGAYYSVQAPGTNAIAEASVVDLTNGDVADKNIELKLGVTVSGYIKNRSGGGIADAWVIASSEKLSYISGTFSSSMPTKRGEFSLTLKPADDYVVEVFPKNGLHQYFGGSIEKKDALLTDASQNVSNLLFSISRGSSVQGYMLYKEGKNLRALSGASVLAYSPGTGITGLVKSGVDGKYTAELPPGKYFVCAWTDTYPVKFYKSTWWEENADLVELVSSDIDGVNITLEKGCNIQGNVWLGSRASKTQVADGEKVYVTASSRGRMFKTVPNLSGTYIFKNLPPTRDDGNTENFGYRLTAFSSNLSREYYDKEDGAFDRDKAARLNLRGGENVGGVNFYLEPGGSISGSFTAAEKLSGSFWARVKSASFQKEKKIFPSGSVGDFTFTALPLGLEYTVSVWAEDFELFDYPDTIALSTSNSPYNLAGATLTKGTSISGTVKGSDAGALQGALVSVIGLGESSASTLLTDNGGNFKIKGLDKNKKYRVRVSASGFTAYGSLTSGASYSVPKADFTVVLAAGFSVSGLLQDSKTGEPVDAYVSLYTSDGVFVASAAVGSDGRFSFASYFAPAGYELKVLHEGTDKVLKAFTLSENVSFELKL